MKSLEKTFKENKYKAISLLLIGLIFFFILSNAITIIKDINENYNEDNCCYKEIDVENNKTIKAVSFKCDDFNFTSYLINKSNVSNQNG